MLSDISIRIFPYGLVQANMYVVAFGKEAFIVDPCVSWDACECEDLEVKAILCTHGHFDHISEAESLISRFHCPIYIAPQDSEMLSSAKLNHSLNFGLKIETQTEPELFQKDVYSALDLGFSSDCFEISVIPTPGHTSGSVCFLLTCRQNPDEKYMFTGDMLFAGSVGRTDLGGSFSEMQNSIEVLKQMDDSIVCFPGHGDRTILGQEKKYNPFF